MNTPSATKTEFRFVDVVEKYRTRILGEGEGGIFCFHQFRAYTLWSPVFWIATHESTMQSENGPTPWQKYELDKLLLVELKTALLFSINTKTVHGRTAPSFLHIHMSIALYCRCDTSFPVSCCHFCTRMSMKFILLNLCVSSALLCLCERSFSYRRV